jgi:hypothetical protein
MIEALESDHAAIEQFKPALARVKLSSKLDDLLRKKIV